jgi:hypothetical protein
MAGATSEAPLRPKPRREIGAVVMVAQKPDAEVILLRHFVKKFEPCLSQAAIEAFTDLLEQWLQEIWHRNMELCADAILSIKESAISLHRQLTGLTSESIKAGSHTRTEIAAASYDRQDGQNGLYSILNFVLQDGASPTDLSGLSDALSRIIKEMERLQPSKRAPNRPLGIRSYPALDLLVGGLGIWSQTHLPQRFNAYVKTNGDTKIATGSLVRMLDSLREFLGSNHQMAWLANYLPTATEHPTYMSTYQRVLRAAFHEGREDTDQAEPAS